MDSLFSLEEISTILDAIVTGSRDRAAELICESPLLDQHERDRLVGAVEGAASPADATQALGDGLRALGAPRYLANECYRASFYGSREAVRMSRNHLYAHFLAKRGGYALDKWPHYFPIYERYLSRFRGTDVKVLEIGVYRGGGLDLLRDFLGPKAQLVGVDIDPVAIEVASQRHPVVLADQTDTDGLARVLESHGPFDVIIDDGGHTMEQQISSAEALLPTMQPGSLYIVEDTHTSYWPEYGGGLGNPGTFVEWAKQRADDVHGYHWSRETPPTPWADVISAVHIHDSVVVLDVGRPFAPFSEVVGSWDFLRVTRPQAAVQSELSAEKEAVVHRLAVVQSALEQAQSTLEQVEADRAGLRDSVERVNDELARSTAQLHDVHVSASWRSTEPLRRLRTAFRRG